MAYVSLKLAGCIEKAYMYNPPYYEPRDLEREELVKEERKVASAELLEKTEKKKLGN